MISAVDENGGQVLAHNAEKGKIYLCPVCRSRVTLKKGPVKTAHFSHYHIPDCVRYLYKRESAEHLELKHDLYHKMISHHHTAMEFYLPEIEQIADLLVDENLALEIQLSTISPELIAARTAGYESLGIDVIWLLDDAALKKDGDYIRPTSFQLSTQAGGRLYTISMENKTIHTYDILHHAGGRRFHYRKTEIPAQALTVRRPPANIGSRKLTRTELQTIVNRERAKRTVQNMTLTLLYQSGVTLETLPEHVKYTTPSDRLIANTPLEWKLFIHHHLGRGTFSMELFKSMLEPRMIHGMPPHDMLAKRLIKEYLMLYNSHKHSELEISHEN